MYTCAYTKNNVYIYIYIYIHIYIERGRVRERERGSTPSVLPASAVGRHLQTRGWIRDVYVYT